VLTLQFTRLQDLRYRREPAPERRLLSRRASRSRRLASYRQLQGKELSYNNIADADAPGNASSASPSRRASSSSTPTPVVLRSPTASPQPTTRRSRPIRPPRSAHPRLNRAVDAATAAAFARQFAEVVIAPRFEQDAIAGLAKKDNLRLIEVPLAHDAQKQTTTSASAAGCWCRAATSRRTATSKVVTKKRPSEAQLADLRFAWTVAQFVKSNAIVFCRDGMTLGIGAGQMSRRRQLAHGAAEAESAGMKLENCVAARMPSSRSVTGLKSSSTRARRPSSSLAAAYATPRLIAAADERARRWSSPACALQH